MLVLRSDWQAALPTLTQLGNGLALIGCLDCMQGSHSDTAFMQLAPLLGITLGTGNHMQCLVSHICSLQPFFTVFSLSCHKLHGACSAYMTHLCVIKHGLQHVIHTSFLSGILGLLCRTASSRSAGYVTLSHAMLHTPDHHA